MRISVVMPNYNGAAFLEEAIDSVVAQRGAGVEVELIVVDGGSTDGSGAILERRAADLTGLIREPDGGPAEAINKGLAHATGDLLAWLNADDRYAPGALKRVADAFTAHPDRALVFGHCPIIDEQGREIRRGITRFKEGFFPWSSRFTIQCINYISQPAMFFRRAAWEQAGALRTDLKAAWDYEYILRLWRFGGAVRLAPPALAAFRWHAGSISGMHFRRQFREEWHVAAADAGRASLQAMLHFGVRWGIVFCYSVLAWRRRRVTGGAGGA